jgi:hypothetical protein
MDLAYEPPPPPPPLQYADKPLLALAYPPAPPPPHTSTLNEVTLAGTLHGLTGFVTVTVCPFTLPPKTNNKATTPAVRRINFLNKFSVGLVAADALNFTFDALFTRDKKEYNDFMPVAV